MDHSDDFDVPRVPAKHPRFPKAYYVHSPRKFGHSSALDAFGTWPCAIIVVNDPCFFLVFLVPQSLTRLLCAVHLEPFCYCDGDVSTVKLPR